KQGTELDRILPRGLTSRGSTFAFTHPSSCEIWTTRGLKSHTESEENMTTHEGTVKRMLSAHTSRIIIVLGGILFLIGAQSANLNAQSQSFGPATVAQHIDNADSHDLGPQGGPPFVPEPVPLNGGASAGLNIVPTYDASVDAATKTVINNIVAFYNS